MGEEGGTSKSTRKDGKRSAEDGKAIDQAVKALITIQIRAPFHRVEEGIVNLLKQSLIADQQQVSMSALSGYVDHFESVHDDDFGWGCGWRNIQIICSFLLSQGAEVKEALFHGAGFVPDIPSLQRWLEIAWMKGFDSSGADYYDWHIYGTRKWIGTTECAALLRSFGVRAQIVSFTAIGGDQTETTVGGLSGSGGRKEDAPQEGEERSIEKKSPSDDGELDSDDTTEPSSGVIDCQECGESSSYGSTVKSILDQHYELCCNCMGKLNISSDTEQDYEISAEESVSEAGAETASDAGVGAEEKDSSEGEATAAESVLSSEKDLQTRTQCDCCGVLQTGGERVQRACTQEGYDRIRNLPAAESSTGSPPEIEIRRNKGGNGNNQSNWEDADEDADEGILHHHLIQWVWNYFSSGASDGSISTTPSPGQPIMTSNRSPLYFQHRGHSRTIIGIEHRQLRDSSEETNLLVLDPYQSTDDMVNALRSRNGWRKLIARDVYSLKEPEYQLCYAEPGIARVEELEDMKVLKSLNYTFSSPIKKNSSSSK